jgi:membrane fusion protein, heavy metal efflux system
MIKKYCFFLLPLMAIYPCFAQESIVISDSDIDRLGIQFADVKEIGLQSGSRFPAVVVTSPNATSLVNSSFSGTLSQWHADPGEAVQAGDPIATIRSAELLEQQNLWLQSNAASEQASFELDRDRQLLELGIVSQQRLEQTQRRFTQAQIDLASQAALLELAGFQQASLRILLRDRLNLGSYQVRAPEAGVLTHRSYSVGEVVASYEEIASIQQTASLWLAAEIPARLAQNLEPGFKLSLANTEEQLTVQQKDFVVDQDTQTTEVLAVFDAASNYRPGQILTLIVPAATSGVLVPADAVVHSGNTRTVYVRNASGVQVRTLQLEPAGENYLAHEGILAGESVVITGSAAIKGMQLGLGQNE